MALIQAACSGDLESATSLIAKRADVNAKDSRHGATALMLSLEFHHPKSTEIALLLIAAPSIDMSIVDDAGDSALAYAARWDNFKAAKAILAACDQPLCEKIARRVLPKDTEAVAFDAIRAAAQRGAIKVVELLQGARGADGKFGDCGWTETELAVALAESLEAGYFVESLATTASDDWDQEQSGSTIDFQTRRTCFQRALQAGRAESARRLAEFWVARGARWGWPAVRVLRSLAVENSNGTPGNVLHDALAAGHDDLVHDLVRLGASVDLTSADDVTSYSEDAAASSSSPPWWWRWFAPADSSSSTRSHSSRRSRSAFALALKKGAFVPALAMLAPAYRATPGLALYASVRLRARVRAAADEVYLSNPEECARLMEIAARVGEVRVRLLGTLDLERRGNLLRFPPYGEKTLALAALTGCQDLFHEPWVHQWFVSKWRGACVDALIRGRGQGEWGGHVDLTHEEQLELAIVLACVALPLNLLVGVPLVVVFPPVKYAILKLLNGLGEEGEQHGELRPAGYNRRYKLWWSDFYLLNVPFIKLFHYHSWNIALIVLSAGTAVDSKNVPLRALILAWAVAAALCAARRLQKSNFAPDGLVREALTVAAYVMIIIAGALSFAPAPDLGAPDLDLAGHATAGIGGEDGDPASVAVRRLPAEPGTSLRSIAALLIGIDTATALLQQSLTFGPLVHMISLMLTDMANWLVLWLVVLVVAFVGLYASTPDVAPALLWHLAKYGLDIDGLYSFVAEAEQTTSQRIVLFLYGIVACNILLPLLGAIMFERYNTIWENRTKFFEQQFGCLVLKTDALSCVPPPLLILSAPWKLWSIFSVGPLGYAGKTVAAAYAEQAAAAQRGMDSSEPIRPAKTVSTPESVWHSPAYLQQYTAPRLLKLVHDIVTASADGEAASGEGGDDDLSDDDGGDSGGGGGGGADARTLSSAAASRQSGASSPTRPDASNVIEWTNKVVLYEGFDEDVARIVFHYGDKFEGEAHLDEPIHMTILDNGKVENPPKKLPLSGDKHQAERALVIFPHMQTMEAEVAKHHTVPGTPNSQFVWQRADKSYAVCHCWPIKVNESFKSHFAITAGANPDKTTFSPRAAAEFRSTMVRLFGPKARKVDLLFCLQSKTNKMPVMLGFPADIVRALRSSSQLAAAFGFVKLFNDGGLTRIVDGNGRVTEKAIHMKVNVPNPELHVLYIKQGWETMAMVKPKALFDMECHFLRRIPLETAVAMLEEKEGEMRKKIAKAAQKDAAQKASVSA